MRVGSANNVRTDTWRDCDAVFSHWQRETRKKAGNEDDLQLLGGTGSQSECLS